MEAAAEVADAERVLVRLMDDKLDRVNRLIGAELLENIKRRDPLHRLHRLCSDIRKNRAVYAAEVPSSRDALHITSSYELELHLELLSMAQQLPHWDEIKAGCVDADFYDHLILTLATKKVFTDNWGLDAQVVPEVSGTRTADLTLRLHGQPVAVEVKSKALLKDPTSLLYQEAKRIIKGAVDSTGNSSTGQLPRSNHSLLVIAGFFVDPLLTNLMLKAAAEYFQKNRGRRRSLIGIYFVSALVYSKDADDRLGSLTPYVAVRLASNPSYTGGIRVLAEPAPAAERPSVGSFQRWEPDVIMTRDPTS